MICHAGAVREPHTELVVHLGNRLRDGCWAHGHSERDAWESTRWGYGEECEKA